MAPITVEIRSQALPVDGAWRELAVRGPANIFMHPVVLNAVYAAGFARVHTLLAWDATSEGKKLVGVWALQERTLAPLWPRFLAAPPYDYAFVSDPVLDPGCMPDVAGAFLDAIASAPDLPKVLRLQYLDGESDTYRAMQEALRIRGHRALLLADRARPFVTDGSGLKSSGSTRKKLRQHWNRLAATGAVDIINDRASAAVGHAFEIFLALEAASWKGAQGTALLCRERDSVFVRRLIGDLGAVGKASVALLRVDERPIAAQVLLYCGRTAYTWKTAFDLAYGRYSPGMLLIDRVTQALFADGSADAIESCSPDGSFMGQLWTGRRRTVDLLLEVGQGPSINFALLAFGARGYGEARRLRDGLRTRALWPRRKSRLVAGVSGGATQAAFVRNPSGRAE